MHGMSQLDELYQAPLAWPENQRTEMIENVLSESRRGHEAAPAPHSSMPFDATESSFLIGASFRLTLRDIIFSSQQRNDQKVLTHSVKEPKEKPGLSRNPQILLPRLFESSCAHTT